jgi:hypothetical protein
VHIGVPAQRNGSARDLRFTDVFALTSPTLERASERHFSCCFVATNAITEINKTVHKFIALTAVGMLLVTSTSVRADSVDVDSIIQLQLTDIYGHPIDRLGGGGPFRADLEGTADDFLTFCLEVNEYFSPGEELKVASITSEARTGGAGGSTGDADPISGTTAYMYTQFRLGDVDFSNGSLLQEAIWFKEQEINSASQDALDLIALAESSMLARNWGMGYLGSVRVLNLYRGMDFSTRAQDMLTWDGTARVPEPRTLSVLALSAVWLSALYAGRTRRA